MCLYFTVCLININIACPNSAFRCKDQTKCIGIEKRCDGIPDCDDASDENGCSKAIKYRTTILSFILNILYCFISKF